MESSANHPTIFTGNVASMSFFSTGARPAGSRFISTAAIRFFWSRAPCGGFRGRRRAGAAPDADGGDGHAADDHREHHGSRTLTATAMGTGGRSRWWHGADERPRHDAGRTHGDGRVDGSPNVTMPSRRCRGRGLWRVGCREGVGCVTRRRHGFDVWHGDVQYDHANPPVRGGRLNSRLSKLRRARSARC